MKRIAMIVIAAMSLATLASCGDENYDQFEVRMGGMKNSDDSKAYFGSERIFYFDDGDQVKMNNRTITLQRDGSLDGDGTDVWVGIPNSAVSAIGGLYYCMFNTGSGGSWVNSSRTFRNLQFIQRDGKASLVLGSTTSTNVLTLWPSCAMLTFSPTYRNDIQVYFKVEDGHIPTTGDFNPVDRSVSNYTEFDYYTNSTGSPLGSSGGEAGFIKATADNASFNYVLIPMTGNSITTKIIIRYTQVSVDSAGRETTTYLYRESNSVTLSKGYRYSI
ncbi:MAG: hypothetical protein IJ761_00785 [Bacteroidales bacterium]|nr:hypothetical protein [Bacteroidales bacterium]